MQRLLSLVVLLGLCLTGSHPAAAYGVLTHHQLIDAAWASGIVPLLLSRYPSLSPKQLREAHAFAYGGCLIQDFGYYPFANGFIAGLTHYVRTGDFVESLFRNAHDANELAFAIGALSHFIGDSIGHSEATNPSVALLFPKLRARYGPSVNYAQDKRAHGQVELAFDATQFARGRLAPSKYLHEIGLEVPRRQLAAAFHETYGLTAEEAMGRYEPVMRVYRFGARILLPSFVYAEALLHRRRFPPDTAGPDFDEYDQHVALLAREAGWQQYSKNPGVGSYILAGVITVVPKVGALKVLDIKGPTAETERLYIRSVNLCTTAMLLALRQLAIGRPGILVANRDLDTGARLVPGGYRLTDETYAKLLDRITRDPARPLPPGLKAAILEYYADPNAPIVTRRNPKKWARVQRELQQLASMSVSADSQ
ncbi:MAG TPA: zinc dependent phospholipase C family protein [Bryobacteraceae bacterium]|nr:zinc dependent phospholipase C family protein [Bryobacteraceae bacterium]